MPYVKYTYFNVYQFTTDTVYMYIYQKCKFGLIAVKSIIFQVMLNFIISIHVYTYYKIQWVPLNLIAVKQICCIFHITLKYNYTYNYVLHVHKVIEIVVVWSRCNCFDRCAKILFNVACSWRIIVSPWREKVDYFSVINFSIDI